MKTSTVLILAGLAAVVGALVLTRRDDEVAPKPAPTGPLGEGLAGLAGDLGIDRVLGSIREAGQGISGALSALLPASVRPSFSLSYVSGTARGLAEHLE